MLKEEELARITMAFAVGRGEPGFNEKEVAKVLTWAEWITFQSNILKLIMDGKVLVNVANDSMINFDDMEFQSALSKLGVNGAAAFEVLQEDAANKVKLENEANIKQVAV